MSSANGQSGYTPKERRIFKFQDGGKWRAADPMAVERAMSRQLGPDWERLHKPAAKYAEFWAYRQAGNAVRAGDDGPPSAAVLAELLQHTKKIGLKIKESTTLEELALMDPGDTVWADLTNRYLDATGKLAAATAVAFKVAPIAVNEETGEETGTWGEAELIDLLTRFTRFMRGLADAAHPLPLPPPSTGLVATDLAIGSGVDSTAAATSA